MIQFYHVTCIEIKIFGKIIAYLTILFIGFNKNYANFFGNMSKFIHATV